MSAARGRAEAFCGRFGLQVPILLAPMASVSPPSLSIAVANAGGLGGCGALLMQPEEILGWAREVRANSNGAFQFNIWIPDPPPTRDAEHEAKLRTFLNAWGPEVPASAADASPPDFTAQCEAMLEAGPPIVSSIMGIYSPEFVHRLKDRGIAWFACATTVAEAREAEAAGADVIVAQGAEAGGHRGVFDAAAAEQRAVGLFSLLPAIVDAVAVPVVATGGIADPRGVAAALTLGASAVQIGSGFLRSPEARVPTAWADAMAGRAPDETALTRAFSGRAARSLLTDYVRAASGPDAPKPAPYPVQRGLTAAMRGAAQKANDIRRMQAWAGQSSGMAVAEPAAAIVERLWSGALGLLP